jgi:hypothetical protein
LPAVDLGSRSAVTAPEFCELRFMIPPEMPSTSDYGSRVSLPRVARKWA